MKEYNAINILEGIYEDFVRGNDKEYMERNIALTEAVKALTEIQQYRAIGTVEKCRAAVEKQRVKKPVRRDMCTCPKCGTYNETIKKRRNTVINDIVYCWHCGQGMEVGETV